MAAYAVAARIGRGPVRPGPAWHGPTPRAEMPAGGMSPADERIEELAGRDLVDVVAERWAAVRELWSQTTFYLFDVESWRT